MRFLDHARPRDAPLDGPPDGRAAKTKDGYCIEFRETLDQHFLRYIEVGKTKPLNALEVGLDRGMKLGALSV